MAFQTLSRLHSLAFHIMACYYNVDTASVHVLTLISSGVMEMTKGLCIINIT